MPELRVLMVERQPRLGWAFEQALRQRFDVDTVDIVQVPTVELALLDAVKHQPDLLIADLDQQGMSGERFLRRFQRLCPGVPILAIVGDEHKDQAQVLAELADGLLFKPFTPRELIQEAARLLIQTGTLPPRPEAWEAVGDPSEEEVPPHEEPEAREEPIPLHVVEETVQQAHQPQGITQLRATLQHLYHSMQAQGVFLVDADGTLLEQVGTLPQDTVWLQVQQALRVLIEAEKLLANALHTSYPQALHVSYGAEQIFLFRAVDRRFWLWLALPRDLEWMTRLGYLEAHVPTLREALHELYPPEETPPDLPETAPLPVPAEEILRSLEPPPPEEAERFWEQVLEESESSGGGEDPEVLSFEEARRLGLLSRDLPGLSPTSSG